MNLCPCKSGKKYLSCCYPIIQGKYNALNVEQLMRSRYTAFVLANSQYLLDSWHSDFRPKTLNLEPNSHWINLEIIKSSANQVHFKAYSLVKDTVHILEEKSEFIQNNKQWFYSTGQLMPAIEYLVSRNSSCHCGSGKKFKRCCLNLKNT